MKEDKARWNEKYVSCPMPDGTSDILKENIHLAHKGKALDIACGMGRNTHFMADKGFDVDAVDISDRSEEHTSELQSLRHLGCRLLLEKKKKATMTLLRSVLP